MTELERNNRISEEYQRIKRFFEKLGEKEKSLVLPLIQNAAFMRIALEDLQEIISEQGPVEAYQNGQNWISGFSYQTTCDQFVNTTDNGSIVAIVKAEHPDWKDVVVDSAETSALIVDI